MQGINVTALREIKLLKELRSPHLVQLLDCFQHKKRNLQLVLPPLPALGLSHPRAHCLSSMLSDHGRFPSRSCQQSPSIIAHQNLSETSREGHRQVVSWASVSHTQLRLGQPGWTLGRLVLTLATRTSESMLFRGSDVSAVCCIASTTFRYIIHSKAP